MESKSTSSKEAMPLPQLDLPVLKEVKASMTKLDEKRSDLLNAKSRNEEHIDRLKQEVADLEAQNTSIDAKVKRIDEHKEKVLESQSSFEDVVALCQRFLAGRSKKLLAVVDEEISNEEILPPVKKRKLESGNCKATGETGELPSTKPQTEKLQSKESPATEPLLNTTESKQPQPKAAQLKEPQPKEPQSKESNPAAPNSKEPRPKESRPVVEILQKARPQSKRQSSLATPSHELQPSEAKEIIKIIRLAARTEDGGNFCLPVARLWPSFANAYAEKITNQIDLQTMEYRLRDGAYKTNQDVKADLHLLYNNALAFNGIDHVITVAAKLVRDLLLEKIENLG